MPQFSQCRVAVTLCTTSTFTAQQSTVVVPSHPPLDTINTAFLLFVSLPLLALSLSFDEHLHPPCGVCVCVGSESRCEDVGCCFAAVASLR